MRIRSRFTLVIIGILLTGTVLVAVTRAAPGARLLAPGGAPTVVAYQGEVRVDSAPYAGNGLFKFAVVDDAGNATYWSNDGSSTNGDEPATAVPLAVSEGLFSVLLGDTTLAGMTQALAADVFSQPDRRLRVWFSTSVGGPFDQLTPDTRIAAVPYALQAQAAVDADTVDGMHASQLGADYQNVVVVAKSGGDYTSVQAAIDSISDAAVDNPYLVWVAPGVYSETVTMKPHVHVQGAGQEMTIITSTISNASWPPAQATLLLARDASLRDLTIGNGGAGDTNTAVLATTGMTRTGVADVTARALGNGANNLAIFLSGSDTGVTLQDVTALAENGSSLNAGLVNGDHAVAMLHGGHYTARGGTDAWGIFNTFSVTMEAGNVTALGEYGSNLNTGLYNWNYATVVLHGGDFTGRGGSQTRGAEAANNSTLTAYGVSALAENGNGDVGNYAMAAFDNSTVTVSGGSFIARGGLNTYALSNELTATMKVDHVTALAENGSNYNYGFWNTDNAQATVRNSDFTGRGGNGAWGIHNSGSTTTLEADSVTAVGENGSINRGVYNYNGALAMLRSGSFIARAGGTAYGIYNGNSGATLETENITVLAENGTTNFSLYNDYDGAVVLRGGSFTGRGGTRAYGLRNGGSGATLEAEGVVAVGENGSTGNYGIASGVGADATLTQCVLEGATNSVYRDTSGAVEVSNSRLVGGPVYDTVTCVAVSRGTTFNANGCP